MRRVLSRSWSSAPCAVIVTASMVSGHVAQARDRAGARRAVTASLDAIPGDDAIFDYRARDVRIVDLDRNGVDEIVYSMMATCNGTTTDCPNAIGVMTTLQAGDKRAARAPSEHCPVCDAQQAAIRASGYADDASAQIPGDIERIVVEHNRIIVTFMATLRSPVCRRVAGTEPGTVPTTHCPLPGRYRQTFEWMPGSLETVGARVRIRAGVTTSATLRRRGNRRSAACLTHPFHTVASPVAG